ncbi:hypothetical protein [Metabacillus fastidiosus]|uniref:hypothetical protein n=1 Tax=Metabacillus fastidiosus TaxID=1458 RepID=UPI003D27AD2C
MSINKYIVLVVTVFIFLSAVTLSIENSMIINRAYEAANELPKEKGVSRETKISKKPLTSGDEIVQKLYYFYKKDVSITVDGHTFPKNYDVTKESFTSQININAYYRESVLRDASGNVLKISYQKEVL